MPRRRRPPETWFPPPSSPRPVEGGLRARSRRGDIGETWWSRRFLGLLESFGIGGRLDRARTYARKGQVLSLDVAPGLVTAAVQGSRARPYRVRVGLPRLSEADWRRAEDAMVSRASFLAALLAAEMPTDIEEAFDGCAAGLFPAQFDELASQCSCPDWANPCKHIAAVYYLLGEALDDDPFLLLRWRGREREELLDNLRALRGTAPVAAAPDAHPDPWTQIETAAEEALAAHDARAGDWRQPGDWWQAGDALTGLRLQPTPQRVPAAILGGLAPLEREVQGRPITELLEPAYGVVTASARDRLLRGGEL